MPGSGSCSGGALCCQQGVELAHPWCDEAPCNGLFCGQGLCTSNWHYNNVNATTLIWNHANQSTLTVPAGGSQVSITFTDPRGVVDCWKESESYFELNVQAISGFGGAPVQTVTNGTYGRSSLYVAGTGDTTHKNEQFRYTFTPGHRYYRASVRAVQNICTNRTAKPGSWATFEFQVFNEIKGKIYLDTSSDAGYTAGKCTSPTVPTATHILEQRNQAPWNTMNFDGWGYVLPKSNWPEIVSSATGAPGTNQSNKTYLPYVIDSNLATAWGSTRGEYPGNAKLFFTFNSPQQIQVARLYQFENTKNLTFQAGRANFKVNNTLIGTPYVGTDSYHIIPPGTAVSTFEFQPVAISNGSNDQWGVAEIKAFLNPNPLPSITSSGDTGVTNIAYWDSAGNFTTYVPSGSAGQVKLDPAMGGLTCTCPDGCAYTASLAGSGYHFYVGQRSSPWFQVHDGSVAAYGNNGLAISNQIPTQCTAATGCTPTMIRTPNSTAPAVITGGGTVDMSETPGNQTTGIDDENKNWLARLSDTPARQNFAYFRRIYKLPSANVQNDFELNFNNAPKPSSAPKNPGVKAYFHVGKLEITSPWVVNAGESYVILVDGPISINASIKVAQGGFLAFISSQNIWVSPGLGTSNLTSTTPIIEGVYIADNKFMLPPSSLKFVGAGTFVGWNGFDLQRKLPGNANNTNPAELFIYRPDFLRNAPEEMKTPRYEWNEINP